MRNTETVFSPNFDIEFVAQLSYYDCTIFPKHISSICTERAQEMVMSERSLNNTGCGQQQRETLHTGPYGWAAGSVGAGPR